MADQPQPIVSENDTLSIIAKLESATGPDRELDGMIWKVVDPSEFDRQCSFRGMKYAGHVHTKAEKAAHIARAAGYYSPAYTASLDAALALFAEKLPISDWWWLLGTTDLGGQPGFVCETGCRETPLTDNILTEAPTAPLAVLLALFRALNPDGASSRPHTL